MPLAHSEESSYRAGEHVLHHPQLACGGIAAALHVCVCVCVLISFKIEIGPFKPRA